MRTTANRGYQKTGGYRAEAGRSAPGRPRTDRYSEAGVTMVETIVALMVILIGLAGLFATSAQGYALLRRSKEFVAAREDILCRLDAIRTLSYSQLGKSSYLSSTLMVRGTSGDASPFATTTDGMNNFTETITVYALGAQLFTDDTARQNATPDSTGEFASQLDTVAPDAPKTYLSNSTTKGDWTLQIANALPSIKVTRAGTGAYAQTTVVTAGDLTSYPLLRVDVTYTWTDSNQVTRTQVASTLISKTGSLQ
jgi:hypothetical protein